MSSAHEVHGHLPAQADQRELLRFTTAGSVDDGKSTLIGRLLVDSQGVYEDQVESARRFRSNQSNGAAVLDFALLTDGLRAEREQGITIDVAYRYFSTPRRKFIIADAPGHEQYTRNMVTGASTANLAVILLDARHGVLPQSRRHAVIAGMLGIRHIVVAVNKMDLVGWDEAVFERIRSDFTSFASQFRAEFYFIPISALLGDNVVRQSENMPWYQGATLLHYLETVHVASDQNLTELRLPVQFVLRPHQDFRGYAGQLASGVLRPGMRVMVLPSRQSSRIKSLPAMGGELSSAFAPMSVTVALEDELDISRGDMLVEPEHPPHVGNRFDARVVWMSSTPFQPGREYLLKHTSRTTRARGLRIRYRLQIESMERLPADELRLNQIGAAVFESAKPLFFDAYGRNRATGSFILMDPLTHETAGAGMITGRPLASAGPSAPGAQGAVTAPERAARAGHAAALLWLPASLVLAHALERALFERGALVTVINAEEHGADLAPLVRSLLAAGMLVICVSSSDDATARPAVQQAAGRESWIALPPPSLGSEEERLQELLQQLERTPGLLHSGD